jgi:hypothetical protein
MALAKTYGWAAEPGTHDIDSSVREPNKAMPRFDPRRLFGDDR